MGDLSKNFNRIEFSCRCGCGMDTVDAELVAVVQDVRDHFEATTINSGCRCEEHNRNEGGGDNSFHLLSKAADIVVEGVGPYRVAFYLENKYPDRYGIGRYKTFTHVDVRSGKARWRG